ncbi:hypothetical protein [Bradyrhizobium liaoningense]|uniref:hypothetical protein n=1 Tax=Bradyrhizobium liaoningense TaxID=43992 RepID=UPI001BA828FF|nr:hypothetical protein [Bradyrhizobium liaoningense]MBR1168509.1 hypothetical protein [Bradyrhizobium liaoningense]
MAMPNITRPSRQAVARGARAIGNGKPRSVTILTRFKRKAPRFRARLFWLTALGFQRLADSHGF